MLHRQKMAHCQLLTCSTKNKFWGINVIQKILAPFLLCSSVNSLGQNSVKPLVLIKAGSLFDAHNGRFNKSQAILVEGNRIKEVGDAASPCAIPTGTNVHNCSSIRTSLSQYQSADRDEQKGGSPMVFPSRTTGRA
jgi:hypothetical protein